MEELLAGIEGLSFVRALRFSRWGYAAVATAHVIGLALLFGAVVALDLRLLGLRRDLPLAPLCRLLSSAAAAGLLLAATSGALLFATRASEYASLAVFVAKLTLVAAGTAHALAVHLGPGLAGLSPAGQRRAGLLSLAIWIAVLVCGRSIAFVAG